jgi:hypothetical protein
MDQYSRDRASISVQQLRINTVQRSIKHFFHESRPESWCLLMSSTFRSGVIFGIPSIVKIMFLLSRHLRSTVHSSRPESWFLLGHKLIPMISFVVYLILKTFFVNNLRTTKYLIPLIIWYQVVIKLFTKNYF